MWIVGLYILNVVCMLIVAIREVRKPAKALNWLAIGLILPVIGFVVYLVIANPVRIRRERERLTSSRNEPDSLPELFGRTSSIIAQSVRQLTVHGLREGRVQILTNGIETYEKLVESIQKAQSAIDLEYFIYRNDQAGKPITDALIERAKSGVQIRFVRDGWGSRQFPQSQVNRMMEAGIECRTIFPARFPWLPTLTHRDHCKIVVIDGKEGFTGSINVGYEYTGLKPDVGFWRDTHLRIKGKAVNDLQTLFDVHWNIASPEKMKSKSPQKSARDKRHRSHPVAASARFSFLSEEWGSELGADLDPIPDTDVLHHAYIQTLESNPGLPTQVIRQAYFVCLTQAARTIDITTPYFVPEADIIMALKTAVARGVRVRLLVPRRVTPKIIGYAGRTYYGELLEAGVQIYMYEKGTVHAKVMIIDEEMAGIGSANYDVSSFRLNFEVIELLYSTRTALELTVQFERDLNDSVPLRMDELNERTYQQRFFDQAARLFAPLL
ncbi:phospholipase D-like domain-containing protein [Paenibacillus sepulcri]|uniref:PLDc N-terminal domain-containing protein n=1 Tax=Paenibacillus sepulcri TaxID=359917 RepID=A0ABS7BXI1_9BACL|nr:PLDc N-terminal domain-containing protein [Paenibacillus sepulcri]